MTAFQYLVLALLLVLCFATLRAAVRGGVRKRIAGFWLLIWIGTGVGVLWPRSTLLAARALGIGRGADLVLYCSVFATLTGFFYIYTRFRRLDRSLTVLVRQLAVENPVLPEPTAPSREGGTAASDRG
jgi:hypothetical protein